MTTMQPTPANRLCLDYRRAAASLAPLPYQIIDAHTHVHGRLAARVFGEAAQLYGIGLCYSMTPPERIDEVRDAMGAMVRFIAIPNYRGSDFRRAVTSGYRELVVRLNEQGVGMLKFWASPRRRDLGPADEDLLDLRAPHNLRLMELASERGMAFMVHVADPDTWFASKYADAARYGTKASQYGALEYVLERFPGPWIAAHMAGWPENLPFLSGLLERHANLYLDTSAAKWMLRELSKHPRAEFADFVRRWRGRLLFGSDIVAVDEHLTPASGASETYMKASSEAEAFDLYASRFWALRTFFETAYEGESPIADPDLMLIDPGAGPLDAPRLSGRELPPDLLSVLYRGAAEALLEPLYARAAGRAAASA